MPERRTQGVVVMVVALSAALLACAPGSSDESRRAPGTGSETRGLAASQRDTSLTLDPISPGTEEGNATRIFCSAMQAWDIQLHAPGTRPPTWGYNNIPNLAPAKIRDDFLVLKQIPPNSDNRGDQGLRAQAARRVSDFYSTECGRSFDFAGQKWNE